MRKTKIVCTLGPATDREGVLRQMLQAGMNVARFNFSHGSYDEHQRRLDQLVALREELHLPVAAMLDTKGPEVRLRSFQNGPVQLKTGQSFTLTTDDVPGDESRCSITYAQLPQDVKPGDTILLDDGLVRLTVLETTEREIRCRVENDGVMKDKKGVNVPGVSLSMPYMNQRDREDILFGIRQGFDFIAASFVRSAADIREIRHILDKNHSRIRIIAKIENQEGVSNLADILSVADGIMVARGDMGVEIDFTEIPAIQKNIIAQCVAAGKPVITATQMLDSMIENPRPTRAEITDVANAIYDGTSAIMLSGETAAGKYPVEAVQTMDAIARKTESHTDDARLLGLRCRNRMNITAATAHAACTTAEDIVDRMAEELAESDFKPVAFELGFGGRDGALPAITIQEGDATLSVSGKVDRVDGWVKDNRLYLRVVDYKSGKKAFDLAAVRMGLDIPDGHVSAGVYNARILPAQAVQQRLVIGPHRGEILLRVAFRRHQKHRVLDRICQIGAQFRHREQPVKGAFQLSGDAPVIHGRGQHHHIRGHVGPDTRRPCRSAGHRGAGDPFRRLGSPGSRGCPERPDRTG